MAVAAGIALLSVVGILVPQNLSPEQHRRLLGRAGSALVRFAGFDRMFDSPLFLFLLGLLGVQLAVCGIRRAIQAVGSVSHSKPDRGPKAGVFWRTIGSAVFHSSLVLFLIAGYLSRFGFDRLVQMRPGEAIPIPGLSFQVRADRFRIDQDEKGAIRNYQTDLTFLSGQGQVLARLTTEVNRPAKFNGFRFYQMTYVEDPECIDSASLNITGPRLNYTGTIPYGRTVQIAESLSIHLDRFLADFAFDLRTRQAYSRSKQSRNPALRTVVVREADTVFNGWVFARHPTFHGSRTSFDVALVDYRPAYSSGIQIKRNPAELLVWIAITLSCAGLILVSFVKRSVPELGGSYERP